MRASEVIRAGEWDAASAVDRLLLDFDARHRRRFHYVAQGGTEVMLDLPRAVRLGHGDALRLADDRLVAIHAAPEPLIEATAPDAQSLLRLAWHIGNRHLPAELGQGRIRLRADHVIAAMLRGLGATVTEIDAPFDPEAGAYANAAPAHADHDHHHHAH